MTRRSTDFKINTALPTAAAVALPTVATGNGHDAFLALERNSAFSVALSAVPVSLMPFFF